MARTGQKVRLECVVSAGLPKPTILWLHNHKPVKETRDIKVHLKNQQLKLGLNFLTTIIKNVFFILLYVDFGGR